MFEKQVRDCGYFRPGRVIRLSMGLLETLMTHLLVPLKFASILSSLSTRRRILGTEELPESGPPRTFHANVTGIFVETL